METVNVRTTAYRHLQLLPSSWTWLVLCFFPPFFFQTWPFLPLLSQKVATLSPSDISIAEVSLMHNTLLKNPTKSANAVKLQSLQFWCHWSGKQNPCHRQSHWLEITCWRMHKEVRGKGFFKDEKNKPENSASQEFSWNSFPFPQKEKTLFFFPDTFRYHFRLSYYPI